VKFMKDHKYPCNDWLTERSCASCRGVADEREYSRRYDTFCECGAKLCPECGLPINWCNECCIDLGDMCSCKDDLEG
jgi:hypothetical protein